MVHLCDSLYVVRWAASGWPLKITTQIELIRQQHIEDEERFRKIQLMDQTNFLERLDGLQVLIMGTRVVLYTHFKYQLSSAGSWG